ncbi:hypothetical protein QJ854_gp588 [Moumouvirus goulette]|uniref:Uncharacterized protein n=1 Tax=Moumouvirus goulette TaxID=1247379 RepID=M1PBA8_9VIRU|nr:hypothetical protein QJ854_gp588 [Moumouvirus goulette]AGF85194.1 hypothetical protein glt_00385 [Moumouvirus goulette]
MNTDTFNVYRDYTLPVLDQTNMVNITSNISNYEADFLLIHFDQLLTREINNNPDIIFNPEFQQFMTYVSEYERVLSESKTGQPVVGPFNGPTRIYMCENAHQYLPQDAILLKNLIKSGKMNPKIYYTNDQLRNFGFNERYIGSCSENLYKYFFPDVVIPTINSWNHFIDTRTSQNDLVDDSGQANNLRNNFNKSFAQINDQIINGDYTTRYSIIERKIVDIIDMLDNLTAASNTEENIVQNSLAINNYYDKLKFNDKDIDVSLIIPKDTIDLVEREKISQQLQSSINKYSKMTSSKVLASTYNIPTNLQNITSIGNLASNLLKNLSSVSNINNPPQELRDLMSSKIYRDQNDKVVVKYLDDKSLKKLVQDELNNQEKYLDLIDTSLYLDNYGNTVPKGTPGSGTSRVQRYSDYYPNKKISMMGGQKINSTYNFDIGSQQTTTISQTGGRSINILTLLSQSESSRNDIDKINQNIQEINQLYKQQNDFYFDNKKFVNMQNLNQRNELLIEMINILNVYNFLINNTTINHEQFFNELDKKTNNFKKLLDDYTKNLNLVSNSASNDIISRLLSNGIVTTSEIKNLLNTSGINLRVSPVSNDEMLNNANTVKILSSLVNKYGLRNMSSVSNDLSKIFNRNSFTSQNISPEKLYQQLLSFYSTLRSLNTSLRTEYYNVRNSVYDMNSIKNLTGNILEDNIDTFNILSKEMIILIQNFSQNIQNLQDIRKQILFSKRRLDDFETFMKKTNFSLYSKKNIMTDKHTNFVKNVFNHNFPFPTDIYRQFITEYAEPLKNTVSNIGNYYNYQKDINDVQNRINDLREKYVNYFISVNSLDEINYKIPITNTINVDNTNRFKLLSTEIWNFITNFSNTDIIYFPFIYNRVNIPTELSQFINNYLTPDALFIDDLILRYIYNQDDDILQNLLNDDQISSLLDKIIPYYIQYNTDDINAINTLRETYEKDKSDNNLINLCNYLLSLTGNNNIDTNSVVNNINEDLQEIYLLQGGINNHWNDDIARKIRNNMILQMRTIYNAFYRIFYEKLSILYQTFNALSLINNVNNIDFSRIQQEQHQLTNENTYLEKLKNFEQYQNLNNIPKEIITNPIGKAVIDPNNCPFPLIDNRYSENFHNRINCKLILMRTNNVPRVKTGLNIIHDEYNIFYNNISPFIDIINRTISSGQTLSPLININNSSFSLLISDEKLLPNSFIFQTFGINQTNYQYNGYETEIINNINDTVFYPYNTGTLSAYLPSYFNDDLKKVGSQITYTNNEQFFINIKNLTIPGLRINTRNSITISNVDHIRRLIETGKYLVTFCKNLNQLVSSIFSLNIEHPSTWNIPVDEDDTLYISRVNKKNTILNVISGIENIYNTVINNNNYYHLDILLNGINDPTLLLNMRSFVENSLPIDTTFNSTIDKTWIFTRKLVNVWYTICSQMLSLFILNGSVQNILNFVKILDPLMDPKNIYNTDIFSKYLNNVDTYYDSITNELKNRVDQITIERNKYPVAYNYASNPIIQYNNFYTNIANTSSQIYILLSVLNNDGSKNILPFLNNIDNESGRLIDYINIIDPYFEPTYIRNKIITLSVPDNISKPDLVRILNDFLISIISDLQLSLQSVDMNDLFKQISSELETGNSKVANYIINTNMSISSSLILSVPRILSSPHITKNIIDSTGTFIEDEYTTQIQLSLNNNDPFPIFILFIADIYRTIFNPVRDNLRERIRNINHNINNTNISDLDSLKEYYRKYFETKKLNDILFTGNELSQIITTPINNNNDINIKYILISPQEYQNNRMIVDDINDIFSSITDSIKPNLYEFYENEHFNYLNLMDVESNLNKTIYNFKNDIQDRMMTLKEITAIINQVMFNNYFKQYAFINNSRLLQHVENIVDNYETILRLTEQKIQDIVTKNNYHILTLSQINNYQAFKSSINKTINNRSIVSKFYKRMSFGLIEYYYDILDSIITCLDNKSFEDMSDLEAYLYQYHYIQLKRCYNLFRWIRQDYQKSKQMEDEINISRLAPGDKYEPILKYKIQTLRTTGDVNSVFLEFQGLRKYLDEYSAVAMDKVQLHLRINDFVSKNYNDELISFASTSGRDVDFLLDINPTSQEYTRRLETGKLVFMNKNNGNNLKINFDLLEKIYEFNNPGQFRNYGLYYGPIYRKMKPVENGIDFERIYNTKIFPDSDVISNYMSIAPNILNNKGTVIMTYGYSGVGKSASLFGRKMDISKGVDSPSNGILQATMDQFTNVDIYFRVYEIYGLGTQYNYYWNPSDAGNYSCYPDFYQCIIHHVLDNSDPNVLRLSDQLIFTNRHDMLAYVMDLKDPARGTNFTINNIRDPNLSGKSRTQYNKYFNARNSIINSTYVRINENHYRNFTDFVDEVDKVRMTGIPIKNLFNHIIKQVKGTINNPISSRSILVYDFEINLDPNSTNPIFVPFLIYDLPGKEDIAKTYVDTSITPSIEGSGLDKIELRRRVFKDIGATEWSQADSPGKERKSTYVLNPLLIPIYDNNSLIMSYILRSISSYGITTPSPNHLDSSLERQIVTDILNFKVNNFGYSDVEGTYFTPNIYPISIFYQNPTNITTFGQLLKSDEFKPEYYTTTGTNIDIILARRLGIPSVNVILGKAIDRIAILSEVLVSVCVVVIGFLIRYKLFDIIVEIINQIVEGPGGSDNDNDGGWSKSKIYAFYEAYYINENVVGLLQYLITSVLNKTSDIQEQISTINNETITDTISNNYRTANRYRAVQALSSENPNRPIYGEYKLIVNPQFLTSDDPLKTNEIDNFIRENDIDRTNGQFANSNTITSNADRKMRNVISFENRGDYDTNKIFRSGKTNYICNNPINQDEKFIINPLHALNTTQAALSQETNRPLLQDFIEPYEQKISFYYVFYVVSNSQSLRKAEEQIKLLNNTMPFINKMDPSNKKKQCA